MNLLHLGIVRRRPNNPYTPLVGNTACRLTCPMSGVFFWGDMPYKDPAKRRAYKQQYNQEYWKRPGVKEKGRDRQREYRKRPGVKQRELERNRQYHRTPKAKQRKRERIRRMGGRHYRRHFEELLKRDGPICGICKGHFEPSDEIHVDHIQPASKGGTNDLSNLQLAHASCNMSKQNKWDSGDSDTPPQMSLFGHAS